MSQLPTFRHSVNSADRSLRVTAMETLAGVQWLANCAVSIDYDNGDSETASVTVRRSTPQLAIWALIDCKSLKCISATELAELRVAVEKWLGGEG